MFTANVLSTTAPAKQVGESSLETGDLQTLPSLPKLSLILRDSGRDEDSRIDADQCTGHVDDVQYAAPGAFLRSSLCKVGRSDLS